eukprot:g8184.t1
MREGAKGEDAADVDDRHSEGKDVTLLGRGGNHLEPRNEEESPLVAGLLPNSRHPPRPAHRRVRLRGEPPQRPQKAASRGEARRNRSARKSTTLLCSCARSTKTQKKLCEYTKTKAVELVTKCSSQPTEKATKALEASKIPLEASKASITSATRVRNDVAKKIKPGQGSSSCKAPSAEQRTTERGELTAALKGAFKQSMRDTLPGIVRGVISDTLPHVVKKEVDASVRAGIASLMVNGVVPQMTDATDGLLKRHSAESEDICSKKMRSAPFRHVHTNSAWTARGSGGDGGGVSGAAFGNAATGGLYVGQQVPLSSYGPFPSVQGQAYTMGTGGVRMPFGSELITEATGDLVLSSAAAQIAMGFASPVDGKEWDPRGGSASDQTNNHSKHGFNNLPSPDTNFRSWPKAKLQEFLGVSLVFRCLDDAGTSTFDKAKLGLLAAVVSVILRFLRAGNPVVYESSRIWYRVMKRVMDVGNLRRLWATPAQTGVMWIGFSAQGSLLKAKEKEYRRRIKLGVECVGEDEQLDPEVVDEGGPGRDDGAHAPPQLLAVEVHGALCEF